MSEAIRLEYHVRVSDEFHLNIIYSKRYENLEKAADDFVKQKKYYFEDAFHVSLETMAILPFFDGTYPKCS